MVTRTDCPCGKTDLSAAQMTMHRRSKAHQEWEAALSDAGIAVEAVAVDEDHELDWPNEDHPGSIQDWLESHNIPIINVPPHSDPDEQRKYLSEETERFRQAGWGKDWAIT